MMKRRWITLLTTVTFLVLTGSGMLAFVLPFSLKMIGLHSLMGFLFVGLVLLHVGNSFGPMKRHLASPVLWVATGLTAAISLLLWWQPRPVKYLLSLSGNLGPAQERFEMIDNQMIFQYVPDNAYRMKLSVRVGSSFDSDEPPFIAIWLENQGHYHIKTLLSPELDGGRYLSYWSFKRNGWQKAREEAENNAQVDVISSDTPNGSFDPRDYILPVVEGDSMPYRMLLEMKDSNDDLPSLVYAVEIDNGDPRSYQLMELVGYPVKEETANDGEVEWALHYVDFSDERFRTALDLFDSALLTIDRESS